MIETCHLKNIIFIQTIIEAYIWSWMSFKLLGKLNCHTQKLKEVN